MTTATRVCEHCHAKTVEYRHNMGKHMVRGLAKLARAGGGPIKLDALKLTYSEQCNFQKLRYFDLVRMSYDADGKRMNGYWEITARGRRFLAGSQLVWSHVWTYRGNRVRYDGDQISVDQVDGEYQQRSDWAADARPHDDGGQP